MNIILLLLGLWARPEALPVGPRELGSARDLEHLFSAVVEPSAPDFDRAASDRIPGQYVVGFEPGHESAVAASLARAGVTVIRAAPDAGFLVCRHDSDSEKDLDSALSGIPGVRFIEPDFRMHASKIPNDPLFLTRQWDKWVMYADRAWDLTTGSASVKVAVADNGVEYWHPDLAARFVPGEPGYDFVGGDDDPKPDNPALPQAFHGTHVSGIIAAVADNGLGVAGWAQVRLASVKVLNDSGSGDLSNLALGIRWAADRGFRVVNMSLGASVATTPVIEACRYAAGRNVVLLAAAGNAGTSPVQYPAALPECICVGATDEYSSLADFSNYGPEQELVAPGVSIVSSTVGGAYALASGTSMACPEVAGVAGLVLSDDPSLSAARVRAILAASASDKGASGRDNIYGYGMVNAYRAVQLAALLGHKAEGIPPEPHRTVIERAGVTNRTGHGPACVYDAQGRLVARLAPGGRIELPAGTFFSVREGGGRPRKVRVVR